MYYLFIPYLFFTFDLDIMIHMIILDVCLKYNNVSDIWVYHLLIYNNDY